MSKKLSREKQTEVLLRTQAKNKEEKREQVFRAIQEIQKSGETLSFPNIAKIAGCSISYLYKWPEITTYIHDLQNNKTQQLNKIEEKEPSPNSLKTLHEVSKQRIRELEAENSELKRQNEKLKGHVAEIFELRDECERLRAQIRELTSSPQSQKVVPLQFVSKEKTQKQDNKSSQESAKMQQDNKSLQDITEAIKSMGIKIGERLQREISKHDPEKVKLSIEAFKQYRSYTVVENPGGCLLAMIRDETEPNVAQKPITSEEEKFDCWYSEATRLGFCIDIPKSYLPISSGQIMVKVTNKKSPFGFDLMSWQDAKILMEKSN